MKPKIHAFDSKSSYKTANLIVVPVPWDLTCSYGKGTAEGPELIRRASLQLDFFQPEFKCSYQDQIYFEKNPYHIQSLNRESALWANKVQALWAEGNELSKGPEKSLCEKVNQSCRKMLDWLYKKSSSILQEGKIPALAGGDHSASEALLQAIGEKFEGKYGVLHIDAHSDLRPSYQGFSYSHGSVMHRVLKHPAAPEKLIQVGVRDLCEAEYQSIKTDPRIHCFFDHKLSSKLFTGTSWDLICQEIIGQLPSKVYISLDVDGLSWEYAPGTGTPVPGGLSFAQTLHLLSQLKQHKKKVIAFDLMECSPGDSSEDGSRGEKRPSLLTSNELSKKESSIQRWNGNVAARLIYYMAGLALFSQNLL